MPTYQRNRPTPCISTTPRVELGTHPQHPGAAVIMRLTTAALALSLASTATAHAQHAEVTAQQLFAAYHANEVRADIAYKGHRIDVIGQVTEIRKDFLGTIVVSMVG